MKLKDFWNYRVLRRTRPARSAALKPVRERLIDACSVKGAPVPHTLLQDALSEIDYAAAEVAYLKAINLKLAGNQGFSQIHLLLRKGMAELTRLEAANTEAMGLSPTEIKLQGTAHRHGTGWKR